MEQRIVNPRERVTVYGTGAGFISAGKKVKMSKLLAEKLVKQGKVTLKPIEKPTVPETGKK